MSHSPACEGCKEYNELSRRHFLTLAGVNVAAMAVPTWMPHVKFAESEDTTRDIIVSVFMRGGADGLTLVAPFGDAEYYAGRPNIAVPRPDSSSPSRGVALNDFFMFPQSMAPLKEAFDVRQLLLVHATGQAGTNSRSHFEAERYMEAGKPNDYGISTGWLARHLMTSAPMKDSAALRGISLTWGGMRQTLVGAPKTLPIPDPSNYRTFASPETDISLSRMYGTAWQPIRDAARDALATSTSLRTIDFAGYRPANGAAYPTTDFGRGLRYLAALIKADTGVEAAHIDVNNWDTHALQGPLDGTMHALMTDFAGSLSAFWSDVMMGPTTRRITLVALTEFGRNARENGSTGTDHGRGSVAFVMGPNVAGGRVLANWPGLAREQLEDRQDLRVTIDHRDILSEIVTKRLGNPNLSQIFPDYVPVDRGITR